MRWAAFWLALFVVPANAESGIASRYCDAYTSLGRMDCRAMIIAHKKLPFHTKVILFNRWNRRWVIATVGDLCPCTTDGCRREHKCASKHPDPICTRVCDMSPAVAGAIGSNGLTPVVLIVLAKHGREL